MKRRSIHCSYLYFSLLLLAPDYAAAQADLCERIPQGYELSKAGKWAEAQGVYEKAVKEHPDDLVPTFCNAIALHSQGKTAASVPFSQAAVKGVPLF